MKIAIIGAGAAGFFAAINVKNNFPNAEVIIFEKTSKILSKVKVSGGGRCNVTNGISTNRELSEGYPRGGKKLKKAFAIFNNQDIKQWFIERGVPLYTQDDMRVFPKSDDSQSIIDCFLKECKIFGIDILLNQGIRNVNCIGGKVELVFLDEKSPNIIFDKVIIASGGSSKRSKFNWLEEMGHDIIDPIPSLFTFNMPKEKICNLMGVAIDDVLVEIQGTKLQSSGPLLITHWGMSGPAVLKLSSFAARLLSEMDYQFNFRVNWVNIKNTELILKEIQTIGVDHPNKKISNIKPFNLPTRLWMFLLDKAELESEKKWNELGKKGINKLVDILSNDVYLVKGKTTFKEEFVTCGGIGLNSIDFNTMQSKTSKNVYFAGEILDIDGVTGGYNFQAAWTTAFIAAQLN